MPKKNNLACYFCSGFAAGGFDLKQYIDEDIAHIRIV